MRNLYRIRFAFLGWALASLFFTAVLLVGSIGEHKPPTFALYGNAVHFALWTLLLPFLTRCTRMFPLDGIKRARNAAALLLIVAVLAAAVMVTQWTILFFTYFPYRATTPSLWLFLRGESGRFYPADVLIGIVIVVAIAGLRTWRSLEAERTRAAELERRLAVSRLEALRMQLHPHFLFNTLHTVASLTVEDPTTARRMVIALGDLLRRTLNDAGDRLQTLAEELEYSDLYLGIEKLRLGNRLVLNYEIEPASARALVPQFLLQPLFENAIRHGASNMTGPCEVHFSASRGSHTLEIAIRNDGPQRDRSSAGPPRFGVGLTNTMDRLRIHYGDRHTFHYADRPQGGVEIRIVFPYADAGDGTGANGKMIRSLAPGDRSGRDTPTAVSIGHD